MTGVWRRTCLIGASDGDDVVIVASIGGAPKHPVWYLNLEANPRVWVQQGAESFWTIAHTADEAEKPRLWDKMVGLFPDYAGYQKKTDRVINPRVCPRVMRLPPYVRGHTHHPGADAVKWGPNTGVR